PGIAVVHQPLRRYVAFAHLPSPTREVAHVKPPALEQHFADQLLTDAEVTRHRHMPKAFTPLLPKTIKMDKFQALLNAGWWQAFDAKQLDETGDLLHEDALIDEEERLTTLGGMLQLNGPAGYPFARWRTSTSIPWKTWQALYYQARGRSLQMV
ncbi:MAG TPA: hypothetical protein PLX97_09635, partial [Gemmatales bacterium]|nr:hypothetical protein [Gemmatales bacterium]